MTKHMTLSLALAIAFAALCSAAPANAANNYFSWKLGSSEIELENITGAGDYTAYTPTRTEESGNATTFSVAYGHRFAGSPLRLEIEATFRSSVSYDADPVYTTTPVFPLDDPGSLTSDINSHTLFANLYVDILPNAPVVPYVGGGIGIAWNVWERDTWLWWDDSTTTSGMAWNVAAGVALKLNRKLMLDLTYRHIDFGEAESEYLLIQDITANEVQLGLRLVF